MADDLFTLDTTEFDNTLREIARRKQLEMPLMPTSKGVGMPGVPRNVALESAFQPPPTVAPQQEERGFLGQAAHDIWTGVKQGVFSQTDTLDSIINVLAGTTGKDRQEVASALVGDVISRPTEQDMHEGLKSMVFRGMGQAVPIILEFIAGTKGAGAALGAAKLPTAIKVGARVGAKPAVELAELAGRPAAKQALQMMGEPVMTEAIKGARWLGPGMAGRLTKQGTKGIIGLGAPAYFGAREAGTSLAEELVKEEPLLPSLGRAAIAGGKGVAVGTALGASHMLPGGLATRMPAMGGIFAGQTALEPEATGQDILASGIVGSMLAAPELLGKGVALGKKIRAKAPHQGPITPKIKITTEEGDILEVDPAVVDGLRTAVQQKYGLTGDMSHLDVATLQKMLKGTIIPQGWKGPKQAESVEAPTAGNVAQQQQQAAQNDQAKAGVSKAAVDAGKVAAKDFEAEIEQLKKDIITICKANGFPKDEAGFYVLEADQFQKLAMLKGIDIANPEVMSDAYKKIMEPSKGKKPLKIRIRPTEDQGLGRELDIDKLGLSEPKVDVTINEQGEPNIKIIELAKEGTAERLAEMKKELAEEVATYNDPNTSINRKTTALSTIKELREDIAESERVAPTEQLANMKKELADMEVAYNDPNTPTDRKTTALTVIKVLREDIAKAERAAPAPAAPTGNPEMDAAFQQTTRQGAPEQLDTRKAMEIGAAYTKKEAASDLKLLKKIQKDMIKARDEISKQKEKLTGGKAGLGKVAEEGRRELIDNKRKSATTKLSNMVTKEQAIIEKLQGYLGFKPGEPLPKDYKPEELEGAVRFVMARETGKQPVKAPEIKPVVDQSNIAELVDMAQANLEDTKSRMIMLQRALANPTLDPGKRAEIQQEMAATQRMAIEAYNELQEVLGGKTIAKGKSLNEDIVAWRAATKEADAFEKEINRAANRAREAMAQPIKAGPEEKVVITEKDLRAAGIDPESDEGIAILKGTVGAEVADPEAIRKQIEVGKVQEKAAEFQVRETARKLGFTFLGELGPILAFKKVVKRASIPKEAKVGEEPEVERTKAGRPVVVEEGQWLGVSKVTGEWETRDLRTGGPLGAGANIQEMAAKLGRTPKPATAFEKAATEVRSTRLLGDAKAAGAYFKSPSQAARLAGELNRKGRKYGRTYTVASRDIPAGGYREKPIVGYYVEETITGSRGDVALDQILHGKEKTGKSTSTITVESPYGTITMEADARTAATLAKILDGQVTNVPKAEALVQPVTESKPAEPVSTKKGVTYASIEDKIADELQLITESLFGGQKPTMTEATVWKEGTEVPRYYVRRPSGEILPIMDLTLKAAGVDISKVPQLRGLAVKTDAPKVKALVRPVEETTTLPSTEVVERAPLRESLKQATKNQDQWVKDAIQSYYDSHQKGTISRPKEIYVRYDDRPQVGGAGELYVDVYVIKDGRVEHIAGTETDLMLGAVPRGQEGPATGSLFEGNLRMPTTTRENQAVAYGFKQTIGTPDSPDAILEIHSTGTKRPYVVLHLPRRMATREALAYEIAKSRESVEFSKQTIPEYSKRGDVEVVARHEKIIAEGETKIKALEGELRAQKGTVGAEKYDPEAILRQIAEGERQKKEEAERIQAASPEGIAKIIEPRVEKTNVPTEDIDIIAKKALVDVDEKTQKLAKIDQATKESDSILKALLTERQAIVTDAEALRGGMSGQFKLRLDEIDRQLSTTLKQQAVNLQAYRALAALEVGGSGGVGVARHEGDIQIVDATGQPFNASLISVGNENGAVYYVVQDKNGSIASSQVPGNQSVGKAWLKDHSRTNKDTNTTEKYRKLEAWTAESLPEEAQDRILNTILEKNMLGKNAIKVERKSGVADDVWERRKDKNVENIYNARVRRLLALKDMKEIVRGETELNKLLNQAIERRAGVKAKLEKKPGDMGLLEDMLAAETQVDAFKTMLQAESEKGPIKWTPQERLRYLDEAIMLNDSVDSSIQDIDYAKAGTGGAKSGDLARYIDLVGDPTVSKHPAVRRIANYGHEYQLAYRNALLHYGRLLDQGIGYLVKDNPQKSKELMWHLHKVPVTEDVARTNRGIRTKDGIFESTDPDILKAVEWHRNIFNDLAKRFDLVEKGIYLDEYATIRYDMNKIWNFFRVPLEKADEYYQLPDSVLGSVNPRHWEDLKVLRDRYRGKNWDQMTKEDQNFLKHHYLKWGGAFAEWEFLPQDLQQLIPREAFIEYFKPRTAGQSLKFALTDDYWDTTMRYLTVALRGSLYNEFLAKANPLLRTLPYKEQSGTWGHLAQRYIENLGGYGKKSISDVKWNQAAEYLNQVLSTNKIPMYLPQELVGQYRELLYRGALGPDTAFRNLTQTLFTWAEDGSMPVLKGVMNFVYGAAKQTPEYKRYAQMKDLIGENFSTDLGVLRKTNNASWNKIKQMNHRLTWLALSPLRLTENINKGIAYFSGLEAARKKGIDFRTAHLIGTRNASVFADTNLERTELEWNAWRKMGKSQFLYGKSTTSPYLQGNLVSSFWPFLSFPTKSIQMLMNGIGESWIGKDWFKFGRFLALTGFLVGAPVALASTLGVDAFAVWGKGALPIDIMPMWYNTMRDIYTGTGGSDSDDFMSKELAQRRVWENFMMLILPQYRWMRKTGVPYKLGITDIKGSWQRLDDKYTRWGRTESPLTDTNFFAELMSVFGFPLSDRREGRTFMRESKDASSEYQYNKSKAVRRILELRADGRADAANNAMKMARSQGLEITGQDLSMAQRKRQIDAYTLQIKAMPKPLRSEWRKKAEEMKKRMLKRGNRPMWGGARESEEEED